MTIAAWPDLSQHITPAEFERPAHIHPSVIQALSATRQHLGRPMYLTQSSSGTYYHPDGDAVPPDAATHSAFSLHRYGVDHAKSKQTGAILRDPMKLCLAQDWDCRDATMEGLFETYLQIERLNLWTGIGLYPFWIRKGFHTDLRTTDHPSHAARWVRDQGGNYLPLTWANYKALL